MMGRNLRVVKRCAFPVIVARCGIVAAESTLEYRFPWSDEAGESCEGILQRMHLAPGGTRATDITFMDTFDGRLYRRGKVFRVERSAGVRTDWVLCDLRCLRSELRVCGAAAELPRFASDLRDERLRSELEPLIGVRALLPQARVRRLRQRLNEIDHGTPTPGTLYLDRYRPAGRSGPAGFSAARLVIALPEAERKLRRRTAEEWAQRHGLAPCPGDVLLDVLAAADRPSGPGFEMRPHDLAPDSRADFAVKRILRILLDVMQANETGLLENIDTEFLHDFRVAVRRSRSVLGQLRGIFPDRTLVVFRRELLWLGSITGPVRDFDVYLLEFPKLQAVLPEFMCGDLGPLKELLEHQTQTARRSLVRSLGSRRYRRFMERWSRFLDQPVPARPRSPRALEPFRKIAGERIWKLYRRITAHGIREDAPGEAIHELRKRCKKIRYLTEFVEPFHGRETLHRPIKDLKALQSHLGAFQDAEVQIGHLRQWSAQLAADPAVPATTLIALGALIGFFDQRQQGRRKPIAEAVAEFGRKENRQRFRRLLNEPE